MEEQLSQFILDNNFPCIMAKSVIKTGHVQVLSVKNASEAIHEVLEQLYSFIDDYRAKPKKLRSFIVVLDDEKTHDFEQYEKVFWEFLSRMSIEDKKRYPHDPRVSDDPQHADFSYSIKSEAFFILALHPQSPRFARRFIKPAIVFNLHQQFEQMRARGVFTKVRNLIRMKDKILQGSINPMLTDFGEKSEVFQYLGKVYRSSQDLNLSKGFFHGSY